MRIFVLRQKVVYSPEVDFVRQQEHIQKDHNQQKEPVKCLNCG